MPRARFEGVNCKDSMASKSEKRGRCRNKNVSRRSPPGLILGFKDKGNYGEMVSHTVAKPANIDDDRDNRSNRCASL